MKADSYIARRTKVCGDCQFYKRAVKFCGVCGCFVPAKVMLTKTKCPLDKWGREDDSEVEYGEAVRH